MSILTYPALTSYFDDLTAQQEHKTLFGDALSYCGHELLVSEHGDYYALPWEKEGRVLINDGQQRRLLSNVCRHRQAIMLRGKGKTSSIVCPLHQWSYTTSGEIQGAPHFDQRPCMNLSQYPLQNWNGLLYTGMRHLQQELAMLDAETQKWLSFEGYRLGHMEYHTCAYNWKTFIEVYLEDYHVAPFHPGLGGFVTCDDLKWQFGEQYSVQTVGILDGLDTKSGSAVYQNWQKQVLQYHQQTTGASPPHGAIWLTIYPNIMVEWYPQVLVVSTLHPLGPQRTLNAVAFFYPEDIALFEPAYMQAQQAAYMETAKEDDEIAERMDAGRLALITRGEDKGDKAFGPYQSPMEDGMKHFHDWYTRQMRV